MVFFLNCYMYVFFFFFFISSPLPLLDQHKGWWNNLLLLKQQRRPWSGVSLTPSLIPCPSPSLLHQWKQELHHNFQRYEILFFFFFNRTEVRVQFILEEVQKVTRNKEKARMLWDAGWHLLIVTPLVQWGQLLSTDWSVWISQLWFKSHGQGKMKNVTCVLSLFHLWALLLDCPLSL